MPKGELEVLLEAAIDLSKKGEFVFYGIFHYACCYTYFHIVLDGFAFLSYKILDYTRLNFPVELTAIEVTAIIHGNIWTSYKDLKTFRIECRIL